jgi:carbon monoxide dehydrogenase subunit G
MNFRMDMALPAEPDRIWPIFFDVARIATLIPGCEQVQEKEPLALYGAVMKQKVGPFKMEAPAEVRVLEMTAPARLRASAKGRDKFTGTTMDVQLDVTLGAEPGGGTRLVIEAVLVVAGRLASLGYPIVKKKSDEMFVEFEKRLRAALDGVEPAPAADASPPAVVATLEIPANPEPHAARPL